MAEAKEKLIKKPAPEEKVKETRIGKDVNQDDDLDLDDELEIELVDDTPEEDRGKTPMPKEIVEELEADELEDYTDKVKIKLKQLKKVWNDERREKEKAVREQQEAVALAQQIIQENKKLKSTLSTGEQHLLASYRASAELEVAAAKREYKEAYEAGDSEKLSEAHNKLSAAGYRLEQVKAYQPNFRASLQEGEPDVQKQTPAPVQRPVQVVDPVTKAWQERNEWWGTDEVMTGAAFGLHQRLLRERGNGFIGTKEYWETIDSSMQQHFPNYFGEDVKANGGGKPVTTRAQTKPTTVVASASRSTAPKKVRLTPTQVSLAKKLGLTPEQYAREALKTMES